MSPDERAQLAEQQAALVRALAGRADAPAGFDSDHVATAAASLLAKRMRGVEKTWPQLAASLGDRLRPSFVAYARAEPMTAASPFADGRRFARYLHRIGELPDAGRVQLLLAEMGHRPIGFAYLRESQKVIAAIKSRRGARLLRLPWFHIRQSDFSQPLSPSTK